MKRAMGRAGVVAGILVLGTGLLGGVADAATYPYDGQNPQTAGCASGATTVASARVVVGGHDTGVIELRYSVACHAGWARYTLNDPEDDCGNVSAGYACPAATETRNNDGRTETCKITKGQSQCYTAMLYDKGMTSFATAYYDFASGTGSTRTANY